VDEVTYIADLSVLPGQEYCDIDTDDDVDLDITSETRSTAEWSAESLTMRCIPNLSSRLSSRLYQDEGLGPPDRVSGK
jgi:hypothetical protein